MLVYDAVEEKSNPEERVLDIGTKDGRYLSSLQCEVLGIDIELSPKCEHVEYLLSDGGQLPVQDDSIDYVVSNMVFEHVPIETRIKIAKEVARVLKSGGEFYVSFPNRYVPLEGHDLPRYYQYLPRAIGVRSADLLLDDEQADYYCDNVYNLSPIAGRQVLESAFNTIEFATIDLAEEFGVNHDEWTPVVKTLPLWKALVATTLGEKIVEWAFPYTAYRCSEPFDTEIAEPEPERAP